MNKGDGDDDDDNERVTKSVETSQKVAGVEQWLGVRRATHT